MDLRKFFLLLLIAGTFNLSARKRKFCESIFCILPKEQQEIVQFERDTKLCGLSQNTYQDFKQRVGAFSDNVFQLAVALKMLQEEQGRSLRGKNKRIVYLCAVFQRAVKAEIIQRRTQEILALQEDDKNCIFGRKFRPSHEKDSLVFILQRISFSPEDFSRLSLHPLLVNT